MQHLKIFKELESTSSILEKEQILNRYKDDGYAIELLYLNLNPHINMQFNKMPCNFEELLNHDKFGEKINYKMFTTLAYRLSKREITGNDAKREVGEVFCRMSKDEFEIYSKILLKAPIGVTATTVNKVISKAIPEFKVLLAPNKLPIVTEIRYPCLVSPKLDGFRCLSINGKLLSRSGKDFGNKQLFQYFEDILNIKDYVFDGELYKEGTSFQELSSILRSENEAVPKGLKYYIFDCVPLDTWTNRAKTYVYEKRLQTIRQTVNGILANYNKYIDIPTDEVEDSKQLVDLYKTYLTEGYEGVMIRDPLGYYEWKRVSLNSGNILKLKPMETIDAPIVGFYEGENSLKGSLGGVIVDLSDSITTRVGSGFSLSDRKEIWRNQSKYIGKVIEISFMEKTKEKSLRQPIFKRFREDKIDT